MEGGDESAVVSKVSLAHCSIRSRVVLNTFLPLQVDRLSQLPDELLQIIFDYLHLLNKIHNYQLRRAGVSDYPDRKRNTLPPSKRFFALVRSSIFHTVPVTSSASFRALAWYLEDRPRTASLVQSIDWLPQEQIQHYHLDLRRFLCSTRNILRINFTFEPTTAIDSFSLALRHAFPFPLLRTFSASFGGTIFFRTLAWLRNASHLRVVELGDLSGVEPLRGRTPFTLPQVSHLNLDLVQRIRHYPDPIDPIDLSELLSIFPNAECRIFRLDCQVHSLLSTIPSHLALLSHSLTSLKLSGHDEEGSSVRTAAPIDEMLSNFPSLTQLSLSQIFFTAKIHLALRNLRLLEHLGLICGQLDVGFLELFEGPTQLPRLDSLELFFVLEVGGQWEVWDGPPGQEAGEGVTNTLEGWTMPFDAPLSENFATLASLCNTLDKRKKASHDLDDVKLYLMTYLLEINNRTALQAICDNDFALLQSARALASHYSLPVSFDDPDFEKTLSKGQRFVVTDHDVGECDQEVYRWTKFVITEEEDTTYDEEEDSDKD